MSLRRAVPIFCVGLVVLGGLFALMNVMPLDWPAAVTGVLLWLYALVALLAWFDAHLEAHHFPHFELTERDCVRRGLLFLPVMILVVASAAIGLRE